MTAFIALAAVIIGLEREGFRVLIHSLIPPKDGGIALGQASAAEYSYKNP